MVEEVEVNGVSVSALVDTGCNRIMCCPPEMAEVLQLQVDKLEHPYPVQTVEGIVYHDTVTREVAVRAFGRRAEGEILFGDFGMLIGMPLLLGSTLRFSKTGGWDVARRLTRQATARFRD